MVAYPFSSSWRRRTRPLRSLPVPSFVPVPMPPISNAASQKQPVRIANSSRSVSVQHTGHEKLIEIAKQRNPHHRLTAPEDVARCIAALCHPATYWLTGNTIHVDGGENIVG